MKKWYSKKRLEDFKLLVDEGYATQDQYDELKNKMETFHLEENEIVNKVLSYFKSIDFEKEVTFTFMLSNALELNSLAFFSDSILWKLYDKFLIECRKEKIKIVFRSYGGPVGIPYNLGFWKTETVEIKKIVYNKFFGCYGVGTELKREYVIFTEDRITYCQVPLDRYAGKNNCSIKISFYPYEIDDMVELPIGEEPDKSEPADENAYNFEKITEYAETIELNHKKNYDACDAIPESIDIYYDNGKKKSIISLSPEETQFINEITDRFAPEAYLLATTKLKERYKK